MITTGYKFCPSCQQENRVDAVVCKHCGKSFKSFHENYPTTKVLEEKIQNVHMKEPNDGIAISLLDLLNPIAIRLEKEFVIGRLTEATEEKIVDLTPYDAFTFGVSRRHLMVRRAGDGYEVTDLDSINGTWVNEQRLEPQLPFAVKSSSQIRLGNMRIFVSFRQQISMK